VRGAQVRVEPRRDRTEVVFSVDEGTDVYVEPPAVQTGAANDGLRVIHVRPDATALRLTVEGRGGRAYVVSVRSPRGLTGPDNVRLLDSSAGVQRIEIAFPDATNDYVRREIVIPLP